MNLVPHRIADRLARQLNLGADTSFELTEHRLTDQHAIYGVCVHADANHQHLHVKTRRSPEWCAELRNEYCNLLAIQRFLLEVPEHFTCPTPVGYWDRDPQMLALVTCPGVSLRQLICAARWSPRGKTAATIDHAASAAGCWLRLLESRSSDVQPASDVAARVKQAANTACVRIERGCSKHALSLSRHCARMIDDALDDMSGNLPPTYLAHGDFHPDNVFVAGNADSLAVLDFQLTRPRFVGFDACYFDMMLALSYGSWRFRAQSIGRMRDAFLRGYGNCIPASVVRCNKAEIALHAMVYLDGQRHKGGVTRSIATEWDLRKIARWLHCDASFATNMVMNPSTTSR